MVKLINGFCYLLCVLCIFGGVAIFLNHIWTPYRSANEPKFIVSLVVIFVGSAIILGINRRFRR